MIPSSNFKSYTRQPGFFALSQHCSRARWLSALGKVCPCVHGGHKSRLPGPMSRVRPWWRCCLAVWSTTFLPDLYYRRFVSQPRDRSCATAPASNSPIASQLVAHLSTLEESLWQVCGQGQRTDANQIDPLHEDLTRQKHMQPPIIAVTISSPRSLDVCRPHLSTLLCIQTSSVQA